MDTLKIHRATVETGGSSTDLMGSNPTTGFMVSIRPHNGLIVPISQFTPETITEFVSNHLEILGRADHYLGTWVDAGKVYIDISYNIGNRFDALNLARCHDQKAIFDLATFESIEVA